MRCKTCEEKVEKDQMPKYAPGSACCRRCEAVFELANRLHNVLGNAVIAATKLALERAELLYGQDGMDEPEYTSIVSLLQLFQRCLNEVKENDEGEIEERD